jgi:8-oxo-dGTP diphosphatase
MKEVKVVAAVIFDGSRVFATQRGYGDMKDGWEFPGGKVEEGETLQQALKREIKEELNTDILVKEHIMTIEHSYPKFHLIMDCFLCNVISGNLELIEAEDAKWVDKDTIDSLDWLPADLKILPVLKQNYLT